MRYAKMFAQVLAAVLVALVPYLATGLGPVQWVNVALVAVGALGVFAAPNVPGASVTKTVLSVLAAVGVVLNEVIQAAGGVLILGPADWIQIALAAMAALGVYAVPNQGQFELAA